MPQEMTEQSKVNAWGYSPEITGLRLFQPRIAFEEDNGTTATGTTGTAEKTAVETPVNQSTTTSAKAAETPVNQTSTEVRNPEKLLELYNAQKDELKELKAFKQKQEKATQDAEAQRLADKGAFEALLPIRVKEALDPVNQMLEAEKKRAEKLEQKAQTWEQKYNDLVKENQTTKLRSAVNQAFTASNGDPDAVDLMWSAYGSKFSLSDDGKPVLSGTNQDISEYMKTLQNDPVGARLFKATVVEGTGTPPQAPNGKGSTGVQPKVLTAAQAMTEGKRIPNFLEKVNSGEIVIKG